MISFLDKNIHNSFCQIRLRKVMATLDCLYECTHFLTYNCIFMTYNHVSKNYNYTSYATFYTDVHVKFVHIFPLMHL